MQINPLYIRQQEQDDGAMLQTQWGYCKQQNAVRLGYCVSVLAAVMGLMLIFKGRVEVGLLMDILVGAGFGAAYFAEQMECGFKRGLLAGASIACITCAYLTAAFQALEI